jgi:hypothetical protein
MTFDLSSRVKKYSVVFGGLIVFALVVSYETLGTARVPEPKDTKALVLAQATEAAETRNLSQDSDDFTERWTAIKTEAYRAAVAAQSRPAEAAPPPAAAAAAPSPAVPQPPKAQPPMAQATEEDLKQYLDERRPRAEERRRDDICKKGRIYFYREHHQYWHCRR